MLRIWPHISHASYLSTSREASVIREHTLTGRHGKHPTAGYVQQRRLAADLMVHHAESTKHIPEVFLDIFFFFLLSAPASHGYPTPRHLVKDACSLSWHLDLTWLIELHIKASEQTLKSVFAAQIKEQSESQVYPSAWLKSRYAC